MSGRIRFTMPMLLAGTVVAALGAASGRSSAQTAPQASQAATKNEDGRYVTADGTPTYNIGAGGTLDWYTFSGFRRYHSECHTCHGPDGEGSTYAPPLVKALQNLSHEEFTNIVVNGKKSVNTAQQQVMPALGENANVMCYLDDIYVYLKARSDGALPRGRPAKREDKPEAATKNENTCFGGS